MSISDRIMVMDGGRILQAGTPAEVYERPASRFVARFVGAANFLEGTLKNGQPDGTRVTTPLGTLIVEKVSNGWVPGDRVAILLRPEAIRLCPPEDRPEPNRLHGTITHTMYTGAVIRYTVRVGEAALTVDLADPRHSPAFHRGDRVSLQLPRDPHLLPDDAAVRTGEAER